MLKVRANHWINYNGSWHPGGEIFEIEDKDKDAVSEYVTVIGAFVSDIFPPEASEPEEPKPKRRGRPKKTD